jgi:hypothetical protein
VGCLLLDCLREFCKAAVGYTDALWVFNAIRVFIVRKSRMPRITSTVQVRKGNEGGQSERIGRSVSAFDSDAVQICQRDFMKAIIPFIPLTADLKNGHEESVN